MLRSSFMFLTCLTAALAMAGCQHDQKKTAHAKQAQPDIVDTAVSAGDFSTLVTAVQAADLVETLKSPGPYTVFAPTDEAFAKLPEGTLEALLADPDKLRAVLLYHVVPGEVMASQVTQLDSATTASGQSLAIHTADGVMVNNAHVIQTDIECDNGVIHVIDTVLIPQ